MAGWRRLSGAPGYLGNKTASGTTILDELGAEHLATGTPIVYTSADSVFQIAAHRIPQGTRSSKGEPARKLLQLAPGEEVVTVLPIDAYDEDRYLVTFSKLGKVKKSPLSEYRTADVDGLQDMKLADGDTIVTALISRGQGEYFVTTDNAQTLRFSDEALRAQGRIGQGVACIALAQGAKVVSASYLDSALQNTLTDSLSLLVITENGSSTWGLSSTGLKETLVAGASCSGTSYGDTNAASTFTGATVGSTSFTDKVGGAAGVLVPSGVSGTNQGTICFRVTVK